MAGTRTASLVLVILGLCVAACWFSEPSYFNSSLFGRTMTCGTVAIGGRGLIGVADLEAQPGDTVTLISLDVPTTGNALVRAFVLKRSETGGGGVGFRGDDLIGEDHSFDALSHPLEGFSFATADGIIQVVVAVYAATPQQVRFDNELLEFQVNGNPREQRFASGGTVWFDPTERDDCALASP